jgi:hypothetical protein
MDPNTQPLPDTRVPDTQEDFENESQRNAGEQTDSQTAWEVNRKRTYDAYQDLDLQAGRAYLKHAAQMDVLFFQAAQNSIETANMVGKQAIRHSDVACDALWTDELNPVTRAAGNDLTGQAPVNAALASTASLDTVYTNLTAQVGLLTTMVTTLAQSLAASNVAVVEALAQVVANGKQTTPAKTA